MNGEARKARGIDDAEGDAQDGRVFGHADQIRFAELSGDWNPIHIDPVHARRTLAGGVAVHGIHTLLWMLDWAAGLSDGRVPVRLLASFDRFLLVGETARIRIVQQGLKQITMRVEVDGTACCRLDLRFAPASASATGIHASDRRFAPGREAVDRPILAMAGLSGTVSPAGRAGDLARVFPRAAVWLGEDVLAALGATTRLVGMVCPGLHSIFKGLDVAVRPEARPAGVIAFAAGTPRHGLLNIAVDGNVKGTLHTLVRTPPVRQLAMRDLSSCVRADAFAGSTVLVAGASRGLGELAAKLLAAGGAKIVATWSTGEADAAGVAADIRSQGGRCRTIRYRIGEGAASLAALGCTPTHAYYFAAPMIGKTPSGVFDTDRLRTLQDAFVDGFWEFADALRTRNPAIRLFYPSTIYVEERPRGLVEYAMAKAAGEILCAEMNARLAPLTVVSARLPRLPTDQTAGLHAGVSGDAVAALLPLINRVQRG